MLFILITLSTYSFAVSIDEFNSYCLEGNIKKVEQNIDDIDINSLTTDGTTPLISAISIKNVNLIKLLIAKGANVNFKDINGSTPLLEALRFYDYNITNIIIESGADVNTSDIYGNTPLFRTVENFNDLLFLNDRIYTLKKNENEKNKPIKFSKKEEESFQNQINTIQLLLSKGADFNFANKQGITPVMQSIIDNNLTIFDLFVKNGFDINSYTGLQNTTPLNLSILESNDLFFDYLISKGININKADKSGYTPIYIAIISGNINKVKYFIEHGIDINSKINSDNDTPITEACKLGKKEIVEYLVKKGADLNIKDQYGFTCIHDSIINYEILKILINAGANVNLRNAYFDTPLHLAVKYNKPESIKLLVEAGAILKKDINGLTPLDYAKKSDNRITEILSSVKPQEILPEFYENIKNGNIEAIKNNLNDYLNKLDEDQNNSLFYAIIFNQKEIVNILIQNKIDINHNNISLITPLFYASQSNNCDIAEILIKNNADVNKKNILGDTPLMYAIKNNNVNMVKLLIDNNADINAENKDKISVIDYAYKTLNNDIINLLIHNNINLKHKDCDGNSPIYYILNSENKANIKNNLINYINICDDRDFLNLNEQTPLHIACFNNHTSDIIDLLITDNNINLKDSARYTPLVYAVLSGNINNVKLLLDKGAELYSTKTLNLLHICLNKYNSDVFKLLLEKEKNIDCISINGTPLNIAIAKGNTEAANLLIEHGADINLYGNEYPLFDAFVYERYDIVKTFLAKNIDCNILWQGDISPLIFAVKYYNLATVKKVIDLGCDINKLTKKKYSPLHLAIYNKTEDKYKIINYLIEKGADINLQSEEGISPIHIACGMGDVEAVKILLAKGADPKKPSKLQLDAIELARDRGYQEILDILGSKEKINKDDIDNFNYKIRIINLSERYYQYVADLIEENLQNGFITSRKYENNTLDVELSSAYVIGEITNILPKIDTKILKFEKVFLKDKSVDLCCDVKIK